MIGSPKAKQASRMQVASLLNKKLSVWFPVWVLLIRSGQGLALQSSNEAIDRGDGVWVVFPLIKGGTSLSPSAQRCVLCINFFGLCRLKRFKENFVLVFCFLVGDRGSFLLTIKNICSIM